MGLRAYGVEATADVRPTDDGIWFVSLDAEPDGIDLEVSVKSSRVRVHAAHGTFEYARLGDALNHAARAAGVLSERG